MAIWAVLGVMTRGGFRMVSKLASPPASKLVAPSLSLDTITQTDLEGFAACTQKVPTNPSGATPTKHVLRQSPGVPSYCLSMPFKMNIRGQSEEPGAQTNLSHILRYSICKYAESFDSVLASEMCGDRFGTDTLS